MMSTKTPLLKPPNLQTSILVAVCAQVVLALLTPGSLTPQSPHLGAVPRFFRCSVRSSPPGVLTIRVLLELVLYLIGDCVSAFYPMPRLSTGSSIHSDPNRIALRLVVSAQSIRAPLNLLLRDR